MYDIERINSIIEDINRFFRDLDVINLDEKSLNAPDKLHSTSMLIFGIMNRAVNLAEEIIVKNDLEMPTSYHECFPTLAKAGLIDKKLASSVESLIKKRGLFAHHYYDLNKKEVLQIKKEAYVIKEFVERVKEIVKRTRYGK